jgi:hypothetical protein
MPAGAKEIGAVHGGPAGRHRHWPDLDEQQLLGQQPFWL